jgi:hypothetical protein
VGLAISYVGSIKSEMAQNFLALVESECEKRQWPVTVEQQIVANKSLFGLIGKRETRPQIKIEPDEDCDPLFFNFDANWKIDDFVKTSFAEIEVHKQIIDLFELLAAFGFPFIILDDSDYYPEKDSAVLEKSRERFYEALQQELENGAVGPIKTPQGRIIDCYYPESE